VALRNLDIIEREELAANAVSTGAHLLNALQRLLDLPVVGDVRGAGLLVSIELGLILTAEEADGIAAALYSVLETTDRDGQPLLSMPTVGI
jgi:adenosylmethionine-8-amino-7-oxononanoate aminotransferase